MHADGSGLHGVRHPVDDVDHGEGEREDGASVDVDGVGIDGFTFTAFPVFAAPFLRSTGLSGTHLAAVLLHAGRGVCGPLGSVLSLWDEEPLIHASHRQREENHGLLSVLHHRLQENINIKKKPYIKSSLLYMIMTANTNHNITISSQYP